MCHCPAKPSAKETASSGSPQRRYRGRQPAGGQPFGRPPVARQARGPIPSARRPIRQARRPERQSPPEDRPATGGWRTSSFPCGPSRWPRRRPRSSAAVRPARGPQRPAQPTGESVRPQHRRGGYASAEGGQPCQTGMTGRIPPPGEQLPGVTAGGVNRAMVRRDRPMRRCSWRLAAANLVIAEADGHRHNLACAWRWRFSSGLSPFAPRKRRRFRGAKGDYRAVNGYQCLCLSSEQAAEVVTQNRGNRQSCNRMAFHGAERTIDHFPNGRPAHGLQPLGRLLADLLVIGPRLLNSALARRRVSAVEQSASGESAALWSPRSWAAPRYKCPHPVSAVD